MLSTAVIYLFWGRLNTIRAYMTQLSTLTLESYFNMGGLNRIVVPGCVDTWLLRLVKVKDSPKSRRDTPRFTDTSLEPDKHCHVCYQQYYEASWLPRHFCAKKCYRDRGWVSNMVCIKEIIILISELLEGPFVLVFVRMRKIMLEVWFLSTSCEYGSVHCRKRIFV